MKWLFLLVALAGAGSAGYYYLYLPNQSIKPEVAPAPKPAVPTPLMTVLSAKGESPLDGYWLQCTSGMAIHDEEGNKVFHYNIAVAQFHDTRTATYYARELDHCPDPIQFANGQFESHLFTNRQFWLINKKVQNAVEWDRGMTNELPVPEGLPDKLDVIAYDQMSDDDGRKTAVYFFIDDSAATRKLYRGGSEDMGKMSTDYWVFLGEEIVNASIQTGEPIEETEEEKARREMARLSGQGFVDKLKGIEALFVQLSAGDEEITREKIEILKRYHNISMQDDAGFSQEGKYHYVISTLDASAGYMALQCTGCENNKYMTYWNVSDGSQLLAEVDRGCGPVCEDSIHFYAFKGNEVTHITGDQIVGSVSIYDFLLDPQNMAYLEQDAWELSYNLPKSGKDIIVSLYGAKDDQVFKGDCFKLIWNDGAFEKSDYQWCPSE
ncbi:MAG: hypothetical protein OEZ23_02010 [Gammaproteobacteria bacterium]|nr:hypothetical protein [Gammaproteobacteria bacterium]